MLRTYRSRENGYGFSRLCLRSSFEDHRRPVLITEDKTIEIEVHSIRTEQGTLLIQPIIKEQCNG